MNASARPTTEAPVVLAVDRIRAGLDGEVLDRSRVVDHLLDLRLLAADDGATITVATIDQLLGDLPGRTLVERRWVDEALVRVATAAR